MSEDATPDARVVGGDCGLKVVESRGGSLPGERGAGEAAPLRTPPVGSVHAFGGGVLRPPERAAAPAVGKPPAWDICPDEWPSVSFDDGVRRSSADGIAGAACFPRGSAAGRLAGGGSVRLAAAALVRGDGAAAAEPRPESDEVVSCMLRSLSTNEALDDGGRSTNSDRRAGTVPLLRKPRLNMDCRLLVEARTAVAVAPPGIHGAPEAPPARGRPRARPKLREDRLQATDGRFARFRFSRQTGIKLERLWNVFRKD